MFHISTSPGDRVKDINDFIGSGGTLDSEDQMRLISIVNKSLKISNEQHFHNWAQCEIQYLIPHEYLICGIWVGAETQPRLFSFSSCITFHEDCFPILCNSPEGLMTQLISSLRQSGRGIILNNETTIGDHKKSWLEILDQNELDNLAAHGLRGPDGRLKSFFCFLKVSGELSKKLLYLLEVLLPILDSSLNRVVASQVMSLAAVKPKKRTLGKREIQIIKLIKVGKTNQVIAEELEISPTTVKNHVQNILKKLKVKTRGHAVAKSIDLGLLSS